MDFETQGPLDIAVVGLDNYARTARALMLAWAIDDRKVRIWLCQSEPMPDELRLALCDPAVIKVAWYAQFERNILKRAIGIDVPIPQWRDPMILARHLSMPGKLESVCEILKVGKDEAKIKDGARLIKLFSCPNGLAGQETLYGVSNGFNDPREYPNDWRQFQEYCIRDVEIERTLFHKMEKLSFPEEQWADWHLDQKINETGIPINVDRARKALSLAVRYKTDAKKKLNELTGLENANSRDQLLPWLKARGYGWGSLLKSFVEMELKNPVSKLTPEAREVLLLRRKSSQNSYKKLEKMLAQVGPDGRLRYQFMFMGASRTGRWSSGGVQVQNFPRPIKAVENNPEHALELLDAENYDQILKEYDGSTLPFVSSCLRMCIEAPPGKKMIVCDLAAIEHRVVGWLSRAQGILDVHRKKRETYLDFAVRLYKDKNFSYGDLKQRYDAGDSEIKELRQNCKPPVLGCGFGLGGGELIVNEFGDTVRSGLWGYALNVCGVDMSRELAHQAVKIYRNAYPEVVQFWADMEAAFKWVLKNGKTITVGRVTWDKWNKEWVDVAENKERAYITFSRVTSKATGAIIRMKLPSGRYLHYLNSRLEMETVQGKDGQPWEREVIFYDGIEHSATTDEDGSVAKRAHKWGKAKNYGGKLCENGTQAVARDGIVNGATLADGMGFEIWGLYHDELATLVPDAWDAPTLEDLRYCMSQPSAWGPTMLLDAAGYVGQYYRRG